MSDLKERKLKIINYQIKELENNQEYLKNYWLRIALIGVLVTLIAPEYTHQKTKPLIFYFNYNYPFCYSVVALFYTIICVIMLITFNIQDKKKLKKLKEERNFIDIFRN